MYSPGVLDSPSCACEKEMNGTFVCVMSYQLLGRTLLHHFKPGADGCCVYGLATTWPSQGEHFLKCVATLGFLRR